MKKNSKITQIGIPGGSNHIPTGALQFKDDWPGLFIRGDEAFAFMLELKQILKVLEKQGNRECFTYVTRGIASIIEQDVIIRNDS
jgi:hypothetical protein